MTRFFWTLLLSGALLAGGPLQRASDRTPVAFDPSQTLAFNLETGDLNASYDNAAARALVRDAFATWGAVSGSRLEIEEGASLGQDIGDLFGVLAAVGSGSNPVVFDVNDAIIPAVASNASMAALAIPLSYDGDHYTQFAMVISGPRTADMPEPMLRALLTRVAGRALGLGASSVNGDFLLENGPSSPFSAVAADDVELMYPIDLEGRTEPRLTRDDISGLLALYGQSPQGAPGLGAIAGRVLTPNGVDGADGVNVIARRIDDPRVAASVISEPVTGAFTIVGLPPGDYRVEVTDAARYNGAVFADPIRTALKRTPTEYAIAFGPVQSEPRVIGPFPYPPERYNGPHESNHAAIDDPSEHTAVSVVANQTTGDVEIVLNNPTPARLLYPWISNRAGQFESVLTANNYGDRPTLVTLTATRAAGETETVARVIPARGFLEESASSLFPKLGSGEGYSVLLTAGVDTVRGRWTTDNLLAQSGRSPSQGVAARLPADGAAENPRLGARLIYGYLPVSGDLTSAPVIVNAGDAPATATLRFFNRAGEEAARAVLEDLPPLVPFARVANTLVAEDVDAVYMIAESDGPLLTGVSFVFNDLGETAIGNAAALDDAAGDGKTLVYPWISNNAGVFESVVAAANYGDAAVEVSLTARRAAGDPATVSRVIPARGFIAEPASLLFPEMGSGPGYAVELKSPSPQVHGQWVTNNLAAASGRSPAQGVAVTAPGAGRADRERTAARLLLGYLPATGDMTSAPVVVNLGANPTDVSLAFYDANGALILEDRDTLANLEPGRPFAAITEGLLPADSGNVQLIASSQGEPITGAVFVFNRRFSEPAIGNATGLGESLAGETIAFVNATVAPMDAPRLLDAQTVVVHDGRIAAIGPTGDVAVPESARIIDAAGRYLTPGLADMHVHIQDPGDLILYLANGVTTVLDCGDQGFNAPRWSRQVLAGERIGPVIYAGQYLSGVADDSAAHRTVSRPEQARQFVREAHAHGYHLMKVYNEISREVFLATVDEAAKLDMKVFGHIPYAMGVNGALAGGQTMVAHVETFINLFFDGSEPHPIPHAVNAAVANDAYVTTTLAAVEGSILGIGGVPERLAQALSRPGVDYLAPRRLDEWKLNFAIRAGGPQNQDNRYNLTLDIARALNDAGAPLLFGTDASGVVGVVAGFAVHEEIRLLAEAGLSAYDILRTATANPGRYINQHVADAEPFGTVTVGARADLLLLEANPLADAANVKRLAGVMARGVWRDKAELQALLDEVAASYRVEPTKAEAH